MNKKDLKSKIEEYGDAIITYKSPNSKKTKYNVCTVDFDTKYIQSKKNRAKEDESTVLMFCWDTDSFRLMKAQNVTSVIPLSSILRNEE